MATKVLRGAGAIAQHYGLAEREIRHLIDKHGLPHSKRGRAIYAVTDAVDDYFAGRS